MCTAISYRTADHYFGRNLDLEYRYDESVTITPRQFPLVFRQMPTLSTHYAIIGMATVSNCYPLYYDATNEKGLSMAGLHFPQHTCYQPCRKECSNLAPFELIPWLLGTCATVSEAKALLQTANIAEISFSDIFPNTPLHWILADRKCAITIEAVSEGLKIYDNPVGILTNSPAFDWQLFNLNNYLMLSNKIPENQFAEALELSAYSRGMGAMGLGIKDLAAGCHILPLERHQFFRVGKDPFLCAAASGHTDFH